MRILIIKLSSLGDVIHCLPSLEALKAGFPEAKIDWLVEKQNAAILTGHPHIHRLIIFPRRSWAKNPWQIKKIILECKEFLRDLRSTEYDMVIDFQGLFRSGFLTGLARGRRKVGFDRVREMAHIFYNEKVPLTTLNQHAVTRYLEIPRYLGVDQDEPRFFLPVREDDQEILNKLLEKIGLYNINNNKIIIINPNTRWPSKIWSWERFRRLIKALSSKGYSLILIGGPDDKARMEQAFQGMGDRVYNLAGKTSLTSLVALFKKGNCLITNDSGPMHLAVAAGLPVIAFFGPTNPVRTGPFGWQNENSKNRVLSSQISCSPCYKRTCTHQKCLEGISVNQVIDELESLLASINSGITDHGSTDDK